MMHSVERAAWSSVLIVVAALAALACTSAPDLLLGSRETGTDGTDYVVIFAVRNAGNGASGSSRVYINARDPSPPAGQSDVRVQRDVKLEPIASGTAISQLKASFAVSELTAKGVREIQLIIDPKDEVTETNETNNIVSWDWP